MSISYCDLLAIMNSSTATLNQVSFHNVQAILKMADCHREEIKVALRDRNMPECERGASQRQLDDYDEARCRFVSGLSFGL